MAKILKFLHGIRNNWKKSVVGVAALSYGVSYSKELYDIEQLMRHYCKDVAQYGDTPLPINIKPRHVTIILNPAAKKGKAKKLFQKHCEPLLHLAGIAVNVIQTGSQNDARKIIMNLDTPTDAIIVAGGDGTLSDVLTGLVRRYNSDLNSVKQCPIGVLPLGQTNNVAKSLYHNYDELSNVKQLIEATMAIINEQSKMMDMIEVKPIEDNPDEPVKPIYAMGTVEWGAWKDAHNFANKYWYWGPLKKYATYIFNGYKENLNEYCNAVLKYTVPCEGCSRCNQTNSLFIGSSNLSTKWWHMFVPRISAPKGIINGYSRIRMSEVRPKQIEVFIPDFIPGTPDTFQTSFQYLLGKLSNASIWFRSTFDVLVQPYPLFKDISLKKSYYIVPCVPDNIDYSKIINEKCDVLHELPVSTSELHIETSNIDKTQLSSPPSSLKVKMGPTGINYLSFVTKGWKKEKDNKELYEQVAEAKNIELTPQKARADRTLYIDNEEYELKPVEIKLLSQAVKVFSP